MTPTNEHRGFSLLEIALSIGISGILLSSIWGLTATSGQVWESTALSSQSLSLGSAAQKYITAENTTLLALPDLAALNGMARIKITNTDSGATANSLQGAGYISQNFNTTNSYGQSYALFVRREDSGLPGVVDAADHLVGLLITTGGKVISDQLGRKIISSIGAAGGFMFAENNPASPLAATTVRGAAGGWQLDLTASGWSGIGTAATVGHMALLVSLLPSTSSGGSGGASALDDLDDAITNYTNSAMYLGQNAGNDTTTGTFNTSLGYNTLRVVTTGSSNSATGALALTALTTGSNNTAFGYNAGATITTGSNNLTIGAGAAVASGTASNQLNIGNQIYGDMSTGQVNFGSSTLLSGISLDASSHTNAVMLARGTTGQRPTCSRALDGAQRWNTTDHVIELCNSGSWKRPRDNVSPTFGGTPPVSNPNPGYFVMTKDSFDGNLGYFPGADAKCLADLTANNWVGKTAANAAGQLVATNIKAYICYGLYYDQPCDAKMQPYTTYYFARSGDMAAGGASFTTDYRGYGPGNWNAWDSSGYFNTVTHYWSNRGSDQTNYTWSNIFGVNVSSWSGNSNWAACNNWGSNSNSVNSGVGTTNINDYRRFNNCCVSCDTPLPLVCVVQPAN